MAISFSKGMTRREKTQSTNSIHPEFWCCCCCCCKSDDALAAGARRRRRRRRFRNNNSPLECMQPRKYVNNKHPELPHSFSSRHFGNRPWILCWGRESDWLTYFRVTHHLPSWLNISHFFFPKIHAFSNFGSCRSVDRRVLRLENGRMFGRVILSCHHGLCSSHPKSWKWCFVSRPKTAKNVSNGNCVRQILIGHP